MKSIIVSLAFLGCATFTYAQDKKGGGNGKVTELPEIVIKSAGKDFSIYLPDKNPDMDVQRLEQAFIAYDIGKDYEGYDNYLVTMEMKNSSLAATYNENGKLMSVVEVYDNVKLPSAVIYSIYRNFPEWKIVKDKFLYTQEDGDIIKKQYNIKLKKDKELRRIVIHPDGEIVKGL